MPTTSQLARLHTMARWVLTGIYLFLCARFDIASIRSDGASFAAPLLIGVSSLLGFWDPLAALFAFTAAFPALNALRYSTILPDISPLVVVFSSLSFGLAARWWMDRGFRESTGCLDVCATLLQTIVSLSLVWVLFLRHGIECAQGRFWSQAEFGFGDPCYFLTSAHLWLLGLTYFYALRRHLAEHANASSLLWHWGSILSVVFFATSVVFSALQRAYDIPDRFLNFVCFMPFEDISSFGSVMVALFAFRSALLRSESAGRFIFHLCLIAILLVLSVESWSRATWIAVAVSIGALTCMRLRRRTAILAFLAVICVLSVFNVLARHLSLVHQPYVARLVSLTRIENPSSKSPERLHLYAKALSAISQHPFFGLGIGAFYRQSTSFAAVDDPRGNVPDFAHNAVLQVAAELGIPSAFLFCTMIIAALYSSGYRRSGFDCPAGSMANAAALSLAIYLLTQMTANSLNVYPSNQFFFWLLLTLCAGVSRNMAPLSKGEFSRADS